MLFNSYIFILLFLPLCLLGYFALNRLGRPKTALAFLLGMSLWFYGANMPVYLLLIVASIAVNYAFYLLSRRLSDGRARKAAKLAGVGLNLAVLFYFKYYDFFISTVNGIFGSDLTLKNILLPLGISFFTFQQISFVIDAFHGEVGDCSLLEYACFVSFFPQLIAGPIVTHDELLPQLRDPERKRFDPESFAKGVYIFAVGLAKKVLLADTLSPAVNAGWSAIAQGRWSLMNSTSCLIVMLAYTLQMYFDFSGYSDMAIGIGKMFRIELPRNFDSPYKATSITEHWKRWHMTLTRFLTKYVYIPLGGSRKGAGRTYLNVLIVYFLSGLWHGAGWTYVLWGLMHGLFSVLTRRFSKFFSSLPKALGWLITFTFINLGFIVFRAPDLSQACAVIGRIFSFDFGPVYWRIAAGFDVSEVRTLLSAIPFPGSLAASPVVLMVLILSGMLLLVLLPKNAYEKMTELRPTVTTLGFSVLLIVWCLFSFGKVSEFLYFNF